MSHDLSELRLEYIARGLHENDLEDDPVKQFSIWFTEVLQLEVVMANAMVLATVDERGSPDARYVLLKEYSDTGFVFYTNTLSQKGAQLKRHPEAALVFYWKELHRQVRIKGAVELLPDATADSYFASRPRGSRISTLVATQSEVVPNQQYLHDKYLELQQQYGEDEVPRPDAWSGYRVIPESVEFWQGRENRLHDRILYTRENSEIWKITRLAP
jgi:pyridoxamine 5'-phosphate oxidase